MSLQSSQATPRLDLRGKLDSRNNPEHAADLKQMRKFISEQKFDDALEIRDKYLPDVLYLYAPFEKYTADTIQKREAWFSNPNSLNDPFDAALNIPGALLDEDVIDEVLQYGVNDGRIQPHEVDHYKAQPNPIDLPDKGVPGLGFGSPGTIFHRQDTLFYGFKTKKLLEKSNRERGKLLIRSLSEKRDSMLMWSHYGRGHTGYCLAYDTKKMSADVKNRLFPVTYVDTFDNEGFDPISASLVKGSHWSYEHEWRIILDNTHNDVLGRRVKLDSIDTMYLGCYTTVQNLKNSCLKMAKYREEYPYRDFPIEYFWIEHSSFNIHPEYLSPQMFLDPRMEDIGYRLM